MKPKYLLLLCFFMTIGLWGQETDEKKDSRWFIGGTISYSEDNSTSGFISTPSTGGFTRYSSDFVKNRRFAITPYVGKKISTHWILGFGLDYDLTKHKNDAYRFLPFQTGVLRRTTSSIGINFFGRYTLNPQKKLQFFLQPKLQCDWKRFKTIDPTGQDTSFTIIFQIATIAGLRYQLNERFGIIGKLGQILYTYEEKSDFGIDSEYRFYANFNPSSFSWGLEFNF